MITTNVVTNYTYWHYRKAFTELFHVWLNFLWFVVHFFSLPSLTRSLLSPWKRMTEERQEGGFDFETIASYIIVNLLSRVVGVIIRGSVILIGLVVLTATTVTGIIIMVFWFITPVIVLALFVSGVGTVLANTLI